MFPGLILSFYNFQSPNSSPNDAAATESNNFNSDSCTFLPSKRGFKMASLNITSLPKHIDELRVFLAASTIDILAINETRLDSSIHDNEVHIPGYEIVRRDRVQETGHRNSRHSHLDRSLQNIFYDSLPHLPLSLERFKPVQVTHYSDSKAFF